jgi:hypothetical protein
MLVRRQQEKRGKGQWDTGRGNIGYRDKFRSGRGKERDSRRYRQKEGEIVWIHAETRSGTVRYRLREGDIH